MFLILRNTYWKEDDYVKHSIIPFGWREDNHFSLSGNEEIVAIVQTEDQRNFLLEKLNDKYVRHLRRS